MYRAKSESFLVDQIFKNRDALSFIKLVFKKTFNQNIKSPYKKKKLSI